MKRGGGVSADLDRFVAVLAGVHDRARAELIAGCKRSHWMWFVFPQLLGLGQSDMARRYGIRGLDEAAAFLAHPVLGPRLLDLAGIVLAQRAAGAEAMFGPVDAAKLRSCATLFATVPGSAPVFAEIVATMFDGVHCPLTQARL